MSPPPRVQKIDFSALRFRADPFGSFAELRELGPVLRRKMTLIGKIWLATNYDAVSEVLKDTETFVRNPRNAGLKHILPIMRVLPRMFRTLAKNMLGSDEPDHRRLRSLVDQAFARQSIDEMRHRIRELTNRQLDFAAKVVKSEGHVDLVEHLARPLPMAVICELLGLPDQDRPKFKKWFAAVSTISSVMGLFKLIPGARKVMVYLKDQFELVRRQPRPGLMTALVEAEHEGQRLSEDELLSMVFLLLVAGHETTVHLISTGILALLQHPTAKAELLADWSKVDVAVEEMLRYNSPVLFAKGRFVSRDIEFHGQELKRGETIMPILAAANYDPAKFDRPNQFDIHRWPNHHVGFGTGPHVCLGLKLARAEAQISIEQLFRRWPELQPAFDLTQPDWAKRLGLRALKTLTVRPTSKAT